MNLAPFLIGAKKAVGALTVGEGAALEAGLIGNATAGYITAALGVVSAVVVYLLDNGPKKPTTVINQTIVTAPLVAEPVAPETDGMAAGSPVAPA